MGSGRMRLASVVRVFHWFATFVGGRPADAGTALTRLAPDLLCYASEDAR